MRSKKGGDWVRMSSWSSKGGRIATVGSGEKKHPEEEKFTDLVRKWGAPLPWLPSVPKAREDHQINMRTIG